MIGVGIIFLTLCLIVKDVVGNRKTSREGVHCPLCRKRTGDHSLVRHYVQMHDGSDL